MIVSEIKLYEFLKAEIGDREAGLLFKFWKQK